MVIPGGAIFCFYSDPIIAAYIRIANLFFVYRADTLTALFIAVSGRETFTILGKLTFQRVRP